MYVTPRRLKKMGLGVRLTAVPDYELREHLRTAATAVDSYCNVPVYPQRYSFKGGSIVGEQQGWRDHDKRRLYPLHTPLKEVSALRIDATNNLFVDFDTDDFYVQRLEGYVELINFALTRVGIWGNAGVPSLGLAQPVAIYDYTYGYEFPVVDEELNAVPNESGEEDHTAYMAENGFWDRTADVVVKVGGTEVDEADYEIDYDSGFIDFAASQGASDEVTVSYTYRVPWEIARANALGAVAFIGESKLVGRGMTGIESIKVEELELRRIGSRSGAEKGIGLPEVAQSLLDGFNFMTVR